MAQRFDFERTWLIKFSTCLEAAAGPEVRDTIMQGSELLDDRIDRDDVFVWSRKAMNDVDTLLDEDIRIQVLTGCACRYPTEDLLSIRERFLETRDMDEVIAMLQERFVMFLREEIRLPDAMVEIVVANRWGLAGEREGNTIIATKIPKSGNLQAYLEESDSEKKRALYCHCPRIRDIVNHPEPISATYCYCGGGFYKSLWEDILQESVEVELLRSVLQGDDVCSFAIHLPLEYRTISGNREGDAASR